MAETMDSSSGAAPYLFGSVMAFPHSMVARTLAVLGLDFVMVDALHTYVCFFFPVYVEAWLIYTQGYRCRKPRPDYSNHQLL